MAHLLLADDDPLFCTSFQSGMSALGYEVETASTGDEAFDRLKVLDGAVDLVFLDILMSGGGGVITLHRIRDLWPNLPVVVITGRSELLDSPLFIDGLTLANDRLSKPARLQEFDKVVTRLLGP
ncbi:response regulator [Citreicella sp. C3M06]|uniref:response regulator n=1 Tax=Citreicella sp. C3M06 TaxID=2841564 RepID=UPI001C09E70F|nr:response regulator [Citreicella sp. C3M06]MBU2962447.1 response regulator [Citreicella sp. C3M06]